MNNFKEKDWFQTLYSQIKDYKKIALLTGESSFDLIDERLNFKGKLAEFSLEHFRGIKPNPEIEDLESAIKYFQSIKVDCFLAVGGGSVIDFAKIVNFFLTQDFSVSEYVKKNDSLKINSVGPLLAIPTTSGTGSESTQFATFYIDKTKCSVDNEFLLPKFAILNSCFSIDLPKIITAETGADALSQAIESFWSIKSTVESREYALLAIEKILKGFKQSVEKPSSESRRNMSIGANLAGKAINITRTTASHAISYPITSYFGVPHGQAVSVTIPEVFIFNSQVDKDSVNDPRGVEFVKDNLAKLLDVFNLTQLDDVPGYLKSLFESVGLKTSMSALGIDEKNFDLILDNGFNPSRMKNNPRFISRSDLKDILLKIK